MRTALAAMVLTGVWDRAAAETPAQPSQADQDHGQRSYVVADLQIPGFDGIRELYPDGARASHVEATGNVDCEIQPNGSLADCRGHYDDPQGYGFAAATAKLFEKYSRVDLGSLKAPLQPHDRVLQDFTWQLSALTIPEGLPVYFSGGGRFITGNWRFPNAANAAPLYPSMAAHEHITGAATVECLASSSGSMQACKLLAETPRGYGFGQATVKLMMKYCHVDPASVKGGLQPGDRARFTYQWE